MSSNVEILVNEALALIKWPRRIGSMYDGDEAARAALDLYAQTREEILRAKDWQFARRDVPLTLLRSAPTGGYGPTPWSSIYPPMPWLYEYAYPGDAIKIRAVRRTPVFVGTYAPRIESFSLYDRAGVKVILANIPSAICIYTGNVLDPQFWEKDFYALMVRELASRLSAALKEPMKAPANADNTDRSREQSA